MDRKDRIRSDIRSMLDAINEIGFRESNVCDDEIEDLLIDIASLMDDTWDFDEE